MEKEKVLEKFGVYQYCVSIGFYDEDEDYIIGYQTIVFAKTPEQAKAKGMKKFQRDKTTFCLKEKIAILNFK